MNIGQGGKMPRVSVIIPTYNRKAYLKETIDSILAQTYIDYETIVIDDGSTDGTDEALLAWYGDRIRYEWQENQGESVARNRGIALARGEYIAFMDSDDLWLPEKLEKQVKLLEERLEVGLVFCQSWLIDAHGNLLSQVPLGSEIAGLRVSFDNLCRDNLIGNPSAVVMRRALIEKIGEFDASIRFGEDWDMWLRAIRVTKFHCIPEPLAAFRRHYEGQHWFPKPEKVNYVLADHLFLLERAFSLVVDDTQSAATLRTEAMAKEYAQYAWFNYAYGNIETACKQLESALTLDPQTWGDIPKLTQHILAMALRVSERTPKDIGATRRYVDNVLKGLPDSLSQFARCRGQLVAKAEMGIGYRQYLSGDWRYARLHILRGMAVDPRWLLNRGMLIRLVEMFLGTTVVRLVRRLSNAA